MSKYRPATLPKGTEVVSDAQSAVPPVRSRAEIKAEWEARQAAGAGEALSSTSEDSNGSSESAAVNAPSEADGTTLSVLSGAGQGADSGDASAESPSTDSTDKDESSAVAISAIPEQAGSEALTEPSQELDLSEEGLVHLPRDRNAAGFVEMPTFSAPTSDDPQERLEHYARVFAGAEYAARANIQQSTQQRVIVQGQILLAMREEELWKALGWTDFDVLVKHRFNIGRNYANKIIRSMPVVRALEHVTSMEMAEKHLRALVPVQERHGDEAVRRTWEEALRKGKITEKSLKEAARFLGFGEPMMLTATTTTGSSVGSPRAGDSPDDVSKAAEVVGASIRSLMKTDAARARQEALTLRKLAEDLCNELGITDTSE
ncbi:hypothetical protein [Kitasatospora sp. MBT66]|uniref:hypothetical protein n=1 Tax=Kitasatospora sp. MBT66 TaxID=1444769 RepID=UPI0005B9E70C|nr:hypothetical protein [Kitasatospora sp. MBT66]